MLFFAFLLPFFLGPTYFRSSSDSSGWKAILPIESVMSSSSSEESSLCSSTSCQSYSFSDTGFYSYFLARGAF